MMAVIREQQEELGALKEELGALKQFVGMMPHSSPMPPTSPSPSLPAPPAPPGHNYRYIEGVRYSMYTETTASDGLEWSLVFAYYHIGGQNNLLVPGAFPTSPTQGYSHMVLASIGVNETEVDAVRFYCHTARHSRKIHFKTSMAGAIKMAVTNSRSAQSDWTSGFTAYPDHSGYLPAATVVGNTLDAFPFSKHSNYHFGTHPTGSACYGCPRGRWECDDYANNRYYTTLHQVWVHFK